MKKQIPRCFAPQNDNTLQPPALRRLRVVILFFFHAIPAQKIRQALRKSRARHHRIASRLSRLHLQIALQMRKKSDDGHRLLQLGLQLGDQCKRLGRGVVQIEDNERRPVSLGALRNARDHFLVALHELHLDAKLAARLLDLGQEEKILNKEEDLRRSVRSNRWRRAARRRRVVVVRPVTVALEWNRGWRPVGYIAVGHPVAVVHWTDKLARTLLLLPLFPARATVSVHPIARADAVAGRGLENGLLVPVAGLLLLASRALALPALLRCILALKILGRDRLRRGWRRARCQRLAVGASLALVGCQICLGLAAASASPMPLRLPRHTRLRLPRL